MAFLCTDGRILYSYWRGENIKTCNKISSNHTEKKVFLKTNRKLKKVVCESTILCQCQFSGFNNILWLCNIQYSTCGTLIGGNVPSNFELLLQLLETISKSSYNSKIISYFGCLHLSQPGVRQVFYLW